MRSTPIAFALLSLSLSTAAFAQGAAPAPPAADTPTPLGYASVAAALQDLTAQDGNGTVVVHTDGWTIINQPMAAAQWSFTPPGHAAGPALVRRIIHRGPQRGVNVETTTLCEGDAAACAQLKIEFETLNDRISQAVKARSGGAPR